MLAAENIRLNGSEQRGPGAKCPLLVGGGASWALDREREERAGPRAQPGSMLEATPAEACEAYAKALEENWDERLYLNFRRKVDELSSHLKHAAQGGREDEKLWAATSGAAADATAHAASARPSRARTGANSAYAEH